MAKTPVPGRVKTRLMPELSAKQAAGVAAALIESTARLAASHWPGTVELHVWPGTRHPLFTALEARYGLVVAAQTTGDLGRKMDHALRASTDRGHPAAVMGCDVPHCPGKVLRDAYEALRQGAEVIGPSRDGGYYLIGLQRTLPQIFRGVPWGSGGVLAATLRNASRCGVDFRRLEELVDIDDVADLRRAALHLPALNRWLPNPSDTQ